MVPPSSLNRDYSLATRFYTVAVDDYIYWCGHLKGNKYCQPVPRVYSLIFYLVERMNKKCITDRPTQLELEAS